MTNLNALKDAIGKMQSAAESWYGCDGMSYIRQFAEALQDVAGIIEQEQENQRKANNILSSVERKLFWNDCKGASDAIGDLRRLLMIDPTPDTEQDDAD